MSKLMEVYLSKLDLYIIPYEFTFIVTPLEVNDIQFP